MPATFLKQMPPLSEPNVFGVPQALESGRAALGGLVHRFDAALGLILPFASTPILLSVRWTVLAMLLLFLWISGQRFRASQDLKKLAEKNSHFVIGRHAWVAGTSAIAGELDASAAEHRFCAFCGASADTDDAIQCGICLQHAHYACLEKRKSKHGLKCKAVIRSQLDCAGLHGSSCTEIPPSTLATGPPHQWQLTSVLPGKPCACCAKPSDSDRAGLDGFRCTWCKTEVCRRCVSKAKTSICSLGRHRKLSLPPAAIVEVARSYPDSSGTGPSKLRLIAQRVVPLRRRKQRDASAGPAEEEGETPAIAVGEDKDEAAVDGAAGEAADDTADPGPAAAAAAEDVDGEADSSPAAAAKVPKELQWQAAVEEVPDDGVPTLVFEGGRKRSGGRRAARSLVTYNVTLGIEPDSIPPDVTPLAILVNTKSGAGKKQGQELLGMLRGLLNPFQVGDLGSDDPVEFLRRFQNVPSLRVLCCGGDGTVGWILSAIDKVEWKDGAAPPLAIVPMGTGNDLARVLGWGGGYVSTDDMNVLLEKIASSCEAMVDRWSVEVTPDQITKNSKEKSVPMGNYMGIGVDGQVALEFHEMRNAKPGLFFSRIVNKAVYAATGARNIITRNCKDLGSNLKIICDGEETSVPPDTESIIVLNINSYAGGAKLWSAGESTEYESSGSGGATSWMFGSPRTATAAPERLKFLSLDNDDISGDVSPVKKSGNKSSSSGSDGDNERPRSSSASSSSSSSKFGPSRIDDGLLEVVAVTGALHLGQIQVGLGAGHPVAQCSELKITTTRKLPMQVDGEPWNQPASTIVVKQHPQALMLRPAAKHSRVPDASVKLEFSDSVVAAAHRKGIISGEQARQLSAEAVLHAATNKASPGSPKLRLD